MKQRVVEVWIDGADRATVTVFDSPREAAEFVDAATEDHRVARVFLKDGAGRVRADWKRPQSANA